MWGGAPPLCLTLTNRTVRVTITYSHLPVMPLQTLAQLNPTANADFLDATVGGGGHSALILQRNRPHGRLLGLDADPSAIARAACRLADFGPRAILRRANFAQVVEVARAAGFGHVDGVLADLGISSDQIADPGRGFSFAAPGPLDMRIDPGSGPTAADLVNELPQAELADLLFRYGDERNSRRIARTITRARAAAPITTTSALVGLVTRAAVRRRGRIHPATRTFQALRIAVNDELGNLERFLAAIERLCGSGARIVMISFHSAEDRLVKLAFRQAKLAGRLAIATPKPLRPTDAEIAINRRARSARLRCAIVI